jgi:hypothetical protein
MKCVFTVMLIATACVVGSTPSFARGGLVHLLTRGGVGHRLGGGFVRNPTTPLGASRRRAPLSNQAGHPMRKFVSPTDGSTGRDV